MNKIDASLALARHDITEYMKGFQAALTDIKRKYKINGALPLNILTDEEKVILYRLNFHIILTGHLEYDLEW